MGKALKRFSLLAAALAGLLFVSAPRVAHAQNFQFNATTCQQNMMQAKMKAAQDRTVAAQKVFTNGPIPSMKIAYCWPTYSALIMQLGVVTDPFGLIFNAVVMPLLTSILNQVCQAVQGAVNAAINSVNNLIRSLLCVPIPSLSLGLNFKLGNFAQGSCNGVSLLGAGLALTGPPRGDIPPSWELWNVLQ